MKITDILSLSYLNIKTSKFKAFIYSLILFFFFLLLGLLFSGSKTISSFADRYTNTDFHYKVATVDIGDAKREDVIKEIESLNIPHISKIFSSNIDIFTTTKISNVENDINGIVELYGNYQGIEYVLDSGRDIEEAGEAVCASSFYPGLLSHVNDKSEMIDMKTKVGKDIFIKYTQYKSFLNGETIDLNTYNVPLKVVGTFDWEKSITGSNACYVAEETFDEIIKTSRPVYETAEMEEDRLKDLDILVLVDKYENLPIVLDELQKNGYETSLYYKLDLTPVVVIEKVVTYLSISIFIGSVFIVYQFIKNTYRENVNQIKLYKFIGYKKKLITLIFIVQYILLTFISFITASIILPIVKLIVSNIFYNNPNLSVLEIKLSYMGVNLYLIFVILAIIIIFFRFMSKKNIEKWS